MKNKDACNHSRLFYYLSNRMMFLKRTSAGVQRPLKGQDMLVPSSKHLSSRRQFWEYLLKAQKAGEIYWKYSYFSKCCIGFVLLHVILKFSSLLIEQADIVFEHDLLVCAMPFCKTSFCCCFYTRIGIIFWAIFL